MREPDIRCDWTPERGCKAQATAIVTYPSGWRRPMCHTHAEIILHGRYDGGQRAIQRTLIRDPRPIAIMLLGLHGSLDAPLRRLLAEPADSGAGDVAIDLAEERGYHEGTLPVAECAWPRIERHEHVWLPVREGEPWDGLRLASGAPTRRCPCGAFEAESAIRPHARSGKTAAMRAIAAARVAAGERVLLVQPEGSRILTADDPFLAMLHDEPNLREDERPTTE